MTGESDLLLARGLALRETGDADGAARLLRLALARDPAAESAAVAALNLAEVLAEAGRPEEAAQAGRQAEALRPEWRGLHNARGLALMKESKLAEAATAFRLAMALDEADPMIPNNLGGALLRLGRPDEALDAFARAVELSTSFLEARTNLGVALHRLGRLKAAAQAYEETLAVAPDHADAHWNLALALIAQGDPRRGFEEYEWRWRSPSFPEKPRHFSGAPWQGQPLAGETLFVQAEQGLGDCVQFVRYAALAAERGAQVVLETPPRLMRLFQGVPGVARLVARGEPAPACDFHVPLMSLPRFFPADLSAIPAQVPYLRPPADHVAGLRAAMPGGEFRIGVAWAGSPHNEGDAVRSCPPELFAPLAELPGVRLYGLQHGPAAERGQAVLPLDDLDSRSVDFAESAAVMACLDLIVSVDTSVVHVAGALGLPVWTLLSHVPDWRWMLGRDDSPWYPTMRLFRQERPGDWEGVLSRVVSELRPLPERKGAA